MLLSTCHTKRQLSGTTGVGLVLWGFFGKQDKISQVKLNCRLPFSVNLIIKEFCSCEPAPPASEISFLHQSLFKGDINSQILHYFSRRGKINSPSKHGMYQRDRSGTAGGFHQSQIPR